MKLKKAVLVTTLFLAGASAQAATDKSPFESELESISPSMTAIAKDMLAHKGLKLTGDNFKTHVEGKPVFHLLENLRYTCKHCYTATLSVLKDEGKPITIPNVKQAAQSNAYVLKMSKL